MNLSDILSIDWVQRLGWMLLHSLWQFAAVAVVLMLLLRLLRHRSAEVRYVIACGGMMAMTLLSLATTLWVQPRATMSPRAVSATASDTSGHPRDDVAKAARAAGDFGPQRESHRPAAGRRKPPALTLSDRLADRTVPWLPHVVATWIVGVIGMGLWHFGGWLALSRLRRTAAEIGDLAIVQQLDRLMDRMTIRRRVRLLVSSAVESPLTFGWVRPVILFPASVLMGLAPDQLHAILAHELAHVRRHDYLVNLLQTAVETVFFYHPAIWWISRQIRVEREHCCDDRAVAACGSATALAQALATLEKTRMSQKLQLAAAGSGGSTLDRVKRILGMTPGTPSRGSRMWIGGALTILLLSAIFSTSAVDLYFQREEFALMASKHQKYLPDYAGAVAKTDLDPAVKKEVLGLIRPAILLQCERNAKAPLGASRVGGGPDLPPDIAWPVWKGKHMVFIAQINLEELPEMPDRDLLPAKGRLYFFWAHLDLDGEFISGWEKKHKGGAPVLYSDAPVTSLVRHPIPEELDKYHRLDPRALRFSVFNTVPDFEHPYWDKLRDSDVCDAGSDKRPDYQVLGYPLPMQTTVARNIEQAVRGDDAADEAVNKRIPKWELLFQGLDLIGDASLYYMIRRVDLQKRRWDKARFIVQET